MIRFVPSADVIVTHRFYNGGALPRVTFSGAENAQLQIGSSTNASNNDANAE